LTVQNARCARAGTAPAWPAAARIPLVHAPVAIVVEPIAGLGPRGHPRHIEMTHGAVHIARIAREMPGTAARAHAPVVARGTDVEALVDESIAVVVDAIAHLDADRTGHDASQRGEEIFRTIDGDER